VKYTTLPRDASAPEDRKSLPFRPDTEVTMKATSPFEQHPLALKAVHLTADARRCV